jgi:hypothetical protein
MTDGYVLCNLDKSTQLVAANESFVLRVRTKDGEQWISKYFYYEIGDVVRGYVRHMLRSEETAKTLDGSIRTLINAIEKLESTVKDTSIKMKEAWANQIKDPVEAYLLKCGAEK